MRRNAVFSHMHPPCMRVEAILTGAAALIPGTIVYETVRKTGKSIVKLGHSSGVTEAVMKMDGEKVLMGGVTRTARRIMDGFVYIR